MISRTAVTHTSLRHNTHHLPHRAKSLPGSLTTEPYNLPRLFPFPFLPLPCIALFFRVCCCGGRPRRAFVPFAFGRVVRNEIHIKQNRSDRCNAGPRFAPCPGLSGVLDLSCLPPFRLLPTCLAAGCYSFQPPYAPAHISRLSLSGCARAPRWQSSRLWAPPFHSNARFTLFLRGARS